MKKYISILVLLLLILGAFYCGGKNDDSSANKTEEQSTAMNTDEHPADQTTSEGKPGTLNNPRPGDKLTDRNPNAPPLPPQPWDTMPKSPEIAPEDLVPGTCEYAAYWFAEYFTSGDSAKALALTADSFKPTVRAVLQQPNKIEDLKRNRSAGYKLLSASLLDPDRLKTDTECTACLTATLFGETRQECTYLFHKINGKWLLIDW